MNPSKPDTQCSPSAYSPENEANHNSALTHKARNSLKDSLETVENKDKFNGAAIIDAQGNEILITEGMILDACRTLENNWYFPRTLHS